MMVIGPSGSGKSSLVEAGPLPQLARSSYWRPQQWLVRRMRPGEPLNCGWPKRWRGKSIPPRVALRDLLAAHPPSQQMLLVVDQLEELLTQAPVEEQRRFIRTL